MDHTRRLRELYAALRPDREGWLDAAWLRFAAQAAALTPGEPSAIAQRISAAAAELAKHAGWFDPLAGPLRWVCAATLIAEGERPDAFLAHVERAHHAMRRAGIRHGGADELIAILVLRVACPMRGAEDEARLAAMRAIYERMKLQHWFLTGRRDLPACALLASLARDTGPVADEADACYVALRGHGLAASHHLRLAADLLLLTPGDAETRSARFVAIAAAIADAPATRLPHDAYEAAALLAAVHGRPEDLGAQLRSARASLDELAPTFYGAINTSLAADVVACASPPPAAVERLLRAATLTLVQVPFLAGPALPVDLDAYDVPFTSLSPLAPFHVRAAAR